MANVMQLDVLSPDAYVFQADNITYVGVQTVGGGVGIEARHLTMMATLEPAPVKYRDDQDVAHYLFVDGGFLEVKESKVTILSVAAETAESIDVEKARADLERAQAKISNLKGDMDKAEAVRDLKRAQARLKTVQLAGAHA
ncbi:MAG: ATP synthase F1 subunit epsilon [Acidaminococcaceae bacterium]|nr:ATP synthase F1 subunit epsilon [Acidaminococcaceae bacterium]